MEGGRWGGTGPNHSRRSFLLLEGDIGWTDPAQNMEASVQGRSVSAVNNKRLISDPVSGMTTVLFPRGKTAFDTLKCI